jgi:hypothetical protein
MMRFRLRTLLILMAVVPPMLAGILVSAVTTWRKNPAAATAEAVLFVGVLLFLWWFALGPREPWKST